MNIRNIVEEYLKSRGFDGLYNTDVPCGCLLDDLAPCGELDNCLDCKPGRRRDFKKGEDCGNMDCEGWGTDHWHIVPPEDLSANGVQMTLKHFDDAKNWVCDCGARYDGGPSWRWNGSAWEHKCPNTEPQCGYFVARRSPPPPADGNETAEYKAAYQAILSVLDERKRQDNLWGKQDHDPGTWALILLEELGEWAREELHRKFGGPEPYNASHAHTEAVHTAAVDELTAAASMGGNEAISRCLTALHDKYRDYGRDTDGQTIASEALEIWRWRHTHANAEAPADQAAVNE